MFAQIRSAELQTTEEQRHTYPRVEYNNYICCDIFPQGNDSANMPVVKQQLRTRQQWSNWEAVLSARPVPIATLCNNERTVGRCVFYAIRAEAT
jgi:hypothetical protein